MAKRGAALAAIIIYAVSLAYFISYMRYGLAYDEGYLLDGVEKLMEGQLIYRDFHHTYAPGRFYLVGAAFRAFGKNILVERLIFALLQALKCSLAFLVVWKLTRSRFALLAPVLIMIAPGPWHKAFFSSLGFLALYAMLLFMEKRPVWMLLCGVVVGLCAVFRQDSAGFAVLGGISALLIDCLARRIGIQSLFRRLGFLVLGLALVALPVLLFFYLQGALGDMIRNIAVDGMRDNMTNRIPYPGLWPRTGIDSTYLAFLLPVKLLFYLPFAVYLLCLLVLARRALGRRWYQSTTGFWVVFVVSVMAFNQSIWRSDLGHLLQTMQYVFLLIPILLAYGYQGLKSSRPGGGGLVSIWGWVSALAIALFLVWASIGCVRASLDPGVAARFQREAVSVGDTEYLGSAALRAGNDTRLGLKRAPVYVGRGEADFFGAVGRFLDANTVAGEYVLAVPQLQMLYFLYDRRNPTRYAHYRRALEPQQEARYIRDIESHGTRYIFLTEPFEGARLGETKESFSQYARRVREWILDHYTLVDRLGPVKILRKKP